MHPRRSPNSEVKACSGNPGTTTAAIPRKPSSPGKRLGDVIPYLIRPIARSKRGSTPLTRTSPYRTSGNLACWPRQRFSPVDVSTSSERMGAARQTRLIGTEDRAGARWSDNFLNTPHAAQFFVEACLGELARPCPLQGSGKKVPFTKLENL